MDKDLKIRREDMESALIFCFELRECFPRNGKNCFFAQLDDFVCRGCLISQFKRELVVSAEPFFEAVKKLLISYSPSAESKIKMVYHLFLGLAAIYSANQKIVPSITQGLIDDIESRIHQNPRGLLREITDDLKNLGYEWYGSFYSVWQMLGLSDEAWSSNILLIKIFLEAINGPKRVIPSGPIEEWRSDQEKEQLAEKILEFLKEKRKK